MKYLLMVSCTTYPLGARRGGGFDRRKHRLVLKTDMLRARGLLLDSQQRAAATALTVRVREGSTSVVGGPCAETSGYLGGFIRSKATDMDEVVLTASSLPWARTGAIEIRPAPDVKLVVIIQVFEHA